MASANLEPIGAVDTAFGGNSALCKLLGVDPLTPGFWDYLLGPFVVGRQVEPTVSAVGNIRVVSNGRLTSHAVNWALSDMVAALGRDPGRVGDYVLEAIGRLITRHLMPHGVGIVIVDLPSTASVGPVAWAFLMRASIVNLVVQAGSTHLDEAREALSLISAVNQQRAQLGMRQLVTYLIINSALPNDNTASQLRGAGPISRVVTLPYSPTVYKVTNYDKDIALRYETDADKYFRQWKKTILDLAREEYQLARSSNGH
jgi:hypothetical protein